MTYSWRRVNGDLPNGSTGQHSNTLTIVRATPTDEGKYYCVASKEKIRVESNRATLNVDGRGEYLAIYRLLLLRIIVKVNISYINCVFIM